MYKLKYSARLIHSKEIDRLSKQTTKNGGRKYHWKILTSQDNHEEIIDDLKERYNIVKYYKTTTMINGIYDYFILYSHYKSRG